MSWYKLAKRNLYQAVAKEITTYIFKRFKKYGVDEWGYSLDIPQIYNIIQDVVPDRNAMWDLLSSMTVEFAFKDLDTGKDFSVVAGMNTMLELKVNIAIDLIVANTKMEKIYKDFYYKLYAAILHEMEHSRQVRNNELNQDYVRMRSSTHMYDLLNNYRNYLLQDIEVEAFAVGIYKSALAQKKNVVDAIREYASHTLIDIDEEDIKRILFEKGLADDIGKILDFRNRIINEFVEKIINYLQSRFPDFRTV